MNRKVVLFNYADRRRTWKLKCLYGGVERGRASQAARAQMTDDEINAATEIAWQQETNCQVASVNGRVVGRVFWSSGLQGFFVGRDDPRVTEGYALPFATLDEAKAYVANLVPPVASYGTGNPEVVSTYTATDNDPTEGHTAYPVNNGKTLASAEESFL